MAKGIKFIVIILFGVLMMPIFAVQFAKADVTQCTLEMAFYKGGNLIPWNSNIPPTMTGQNQLRVKVIRDHNARVPCQEALLLKVKVSRSYYPPLPPEEGGSVDEPLYPNPLEVEMSPSQNVFEQTLNLGDGTPSYIYKYYFEIRSKQYPTREVNYISRDVFFAKAGSPTPPVTTPSPTGTTPTPSITSPPQLPNVNTGITGVPDWDASTGVFGNPLTAKSVPELIARIIKILLSIIASIAVIVIIISGFRMVMYGSNPGELAKAKSAIVWSILGLVVALLSFSIVAIIQGIIQR